MKLPWATAAAPCRPCRNAYSPTLLRTIGAGFAGADLAEWAKAMHPIARIERQGKSSIRRRVLLALSARREDYAINVLQEYSRAFFLKTVALRGQFALHAGHAAGIFRVELAAGFQGAPVGRRDFFAGGRCFLRGVRGDPRENSCGNRARC